MTKARNWPVRVVNFKFERQLDTSLHLEEDEVFSSVHGDLINLFKCDFDLSRVQCRCCLGDADSFLGPEIKFVLLELKVNSLKSWFFDA